jgi:hypothetical protein
MVAYQKIIINIPISDMLLDSIATLWPAANQIERSNRHYVFDVTALSETEAVAMFDHLTNRLIDII